PPHTPPPFPYTTLFRSVGPDEADPRPRLGLEDVGVEPLGPQDGSLVARADQRVLADRPVAPDDAVTGHDQRDRVMAERRPDRAQDRKSTRLNSSHDQTS